MSQPYSFLIEVNAMPNIDQLSIEIEANSDKATQAIKTLTSSLNGLSLALNRINTNSISKFARSVESLSKSGRMVSDTNRALDSMAANIAKNFNIKSKEGLNAIRDGLNEVAQASKQFQKGQTDALYADVERTTSALQEVIVKYSTLKTKAENTAQAVRDFVSAQNEAGRKVSLAGIASELGDDLSHVRKVLGSGFTSTFNAASAGVSDLEEFIRRLDKECGTSFGTKALDESVQDIVKTLEQAKTGGEKFEDSLYYQQQLETQASVQANKYADSISRLVQVDLSKSSTDIENLVSELGKLSTVQLPDFKPFADTISTLNRMSTDRVVQNIQAVKSALSDTNIQTSRLEEGLTAISGDVSGSASGMTSLASSTQSFATSISTAAAKYGEFNDLSGLSRIKSVLQGIDNTTQSLVAKTKEYKTALVEVANVSSEIDPYFKDIQNTWSKLGQDSGKVKDISKGFDFGKAKSAVVSVNAALVGLQKTVEKVSSALGKLGDYGIKGLKAVYMPLQGLVNEYKEKLSTITGHFKKFKANVEASLTKMSKFWQRVMKTFTFMLVRKAITAIIKDVKEAVDELALFEKNLGTLSGGQFNKSLSEITADFHYIGRAIVAAFEPLINYVVPALNAVANAVANVLALVGEFFAAFTGQSYFVKAKKTVVDYGDSLDKNTKKLKEQKKLLLGIDEINNLPKKDDDSSSGSGGVSYKDAFEEKPVSDAMRGLAEKIKGILDQIFAPLKAAWDRVGPYVMHEFRYLWEQIKGLAADIGRDFLTMWNEPETQRILESILRTVGNLAGGLGNLIYNFRESWDMYGLGIFQKLRDNFGILQGWVEKTSLAFKNWARDVRFDNLLGAIDQLLLKTQALCNFIGGVFYDVMTRVVMKFVEFLIEDGIPHLITTIGEVIDAFDFDKIRGDLQILEDAFEHMAEEIDKGVTDAIGNVGKALADWMNSDEFTKFCEALARFMGLITEERVEKLFTALGLGLLDTAKGLADFTTSEGFNKFVDKIIEWYDSKSAEEIAGYLEKIAGAIALFKFAQFVGPGVAGFLSFITTLMTTSNIASIAGDLSTLAGSTTAVGGAAGTAGTSTTGFGAALSGLALPIGIAVFALATLVESFGGIKGLIDELKGRFDEIKERISKAVNEAFIPMDGAIKIVKEAFSNLKESLGSFKGAWDLILDTLQIVIDVLGAGLGGALSGIVTAFGGLINFLSGVINIVGGVLSFIAGVIQGIIGAIQLFVGVLTGNQEIIDKAMGTISESAENMGKAINDILKGIGEAFTGAFEFVFGLVAGFVNGIVDFFKELKYQLIGDPIVIDMVNGVLGWFSTLFTDGVQFIKDLVTDVIGFFGDLLTGAVTKAGEIKDQVVGKFEEFKQGAEEKFGAFKDGAITKFGEVKEAVLTKAGEIKTEAVTRFGEFKTEAEKKFTDFKTNAGKAIGDAKTNILKLAGDIKKDFVDKVKEIPKEAKAKFGELKTAANDKFNEVKSKIKDKMNESVDAIKDKLEKMKSKFEGVKLESIATNIIRGFTSGLKSAWQGVVQWANEAVSNLKKKFQEALKIQSPSKVFEEYGMYTVEGFNQGLEKFKDTTDKTVDDWVDGFSDVQVDLTPTLNTNSLSMPQMQNSILANNNAQNATQTNNTNNEIKVVLQLDGKTIYEQVVKQNNQQILRTGKSALAY